MANTTVAPANNGYSKIQDIKEDISNLKTDVMALGQNLQKDGQEKLEEIKKSAIKNGSKELKLIEEKVKSHPAQSVAVAFCAGVVFSFLMGRR